MPRREDARDTGHADRRGRPPAPPRSAAPGSDPASTPLGRRFAEHLRAGREVRPGDTVLVALSGGIDSVALLHLLRFLPALGLRVAAAHFDHRMRPSSTADALWVAGLCRAWEVPLVHGRATAPLTAEADARDARYRFLRSARRTAGARWILTAHHADDQAETVLFRIARGTGPRGLRGIAPRRGRILRPLLPFRRAEIEAYAAAMRIRYREDPTNRDPRFARNRLRLEVLPLLERTVPGATAALARLARLAAHDEAAWEHILDRLEAEAVLDRRNDTITLARPVLLSYDPPVRARVLRRAFSYLGETPGQRGTTAAVEFTISGASGTAIDVAGGLRVERAFDRIIVRRRHARSATPRVERTVVIERAGHGADTAVLAGRRYRVEWSLAACPADRRTEAFSLDGLAFPLVVRGWRAGDRIRLAYGTKKLKKLFGERHVGRAERSTLPVVADARGRVLWVTGVARTAAVRPDPARPNLCITVSDSDGDIAGDLGPNGRTRA